MGALVFSEIDSLIDSLGSEVAVPPSVYVFRLCLNGWADGNNQKQEKRRSYSYAFFIIRLSQPVADYLALGGASFTSNPYSVSFWGRSGKLALTTSRTERRNCPTLACRRISARDSAFGTPSSAWQLQFCEQSFKIEFLS